MKLMNGNTKHRERNSEGCTVLTCGCAFTDVMWLQQCDDHFAEWAALHAFAAEDHAFAGSEA